jgi:hypothetical protein
MHVVGSSMVRNLEFNNVILGNGMHVGERQKKWHHIGCNNWEGPFEWGSTDKHTIVLFELTN